VIVETAEFRNLLASGGGMGDKAIESDSSEDSLEAVEQAYKAHALNKTNTIPIGLVTFVFSHFDGIKLTGLW